MAITCTIDENGITAPEYEDVLSYLQDTYRSIFGEDIYLGNDSQDGQFLGILAAAINDANSSCVAVYNAFSPSTAQGAGLSSVVKINGLSRSVASNSTCLVTITGQVGTTIVNGVVSDGEYSWDLPTVFVIPSAGEIEVTATAQDDGAITAASGTLTTIETPVYGWQSVTNSQAATPGTDVETDASLRVRQSASVALPSITTLDGIVAIIGELDGVTRVKCYENDTDTTDSNGLPEHSIAVVVEGGDSAEIAEAIAIKKCPGTYTYGSTAVTVTDSRGIPKTIRYSSPAEIDLEIEITLTAGTGYTTAIADEIKATLVAYVDGMDIGESLIVNRLYGPALIQSSENAEKFSIDSILADVLGGTPGTTTIAIDFDEVAVLSADNITITVS